MMPTAVFIDSAAVLCGGLLGAWVTRLGANIRSEAVNPILGLVSMCLGIVSVVGVHQMPVVALAVLLGTGLGALVGLERLLTRAASRLIRRPASGGEDADGAADRRAVQLVSVTVLFCASGTGIVGAFTAGATGEMGILLSKSILDFCTAASFAALLGAVVSLICLPQLLVLLVCFFAAPLVMRAATPDMLANFTACGGVLMLGTGLRIAGIKQYPVVDMLPALVLVMPLSALWNSLFSLA